MRLPAGTGDHFLQRQPASGFEDAVHFRIKPITIGDVHRGVLRPDHVEGHFFERQVERVALAIADLSGQPGALGQHLRHTAEFGGQVDALDLAAVAAGEKSRWPADPGPDIGHPFATAQPGEIGQSDRRLPLPAMKLVDRSEIVWRQMVDVLPSPLQRRENDPAEILTGIMGFNGIVRQFLLLGHRNALPERWPPLLLADTT